MEYYTGTLKEEELQVPCVFDFAHEKDAKEFLKLIIQFVESHESTNRVDYYERIPKKETISKLK